MAVDPVCGMYVSEDSKIYSEKDGTRYYFCSQGCKDKFDEPDFESKNLLYAILIFLYFILLESASLFITAR